MTAPETPAPGPAWCPGRRTVLAAAGAVGAAGLLAACGGGSGTGVTMATADPDEPVITDLETLRAEGAVIFAEGDGMAIAVLVGDDVVAYSARCTHTGCTVGWDGDAQQIACPCHGSRFDPADDGAVLQGPAAAPLPAVAVRVDEASGEVRRA